MQHATSNDSPSGWWRRWWPQRPAAAAPAPESPLPAQFGRFQVTGLLGRGASGQVFVGQSGEQLVAIKTLELDATVTAREQAEHRARFERQAQVMRNLAHPDIVRVVDQGQSAGGMPWIAMELAAGAELSRYSRPNRLLPEPVVLRVIARIAGALAHAHSRGVVHRDLKPANVRIDLASDQIKLLDFGVARLEDAAVTRTGVTLGTPAYMAPEQLTGDQADARSDVYALGVMLYELLCGRLPHPATTLGELLRAVSAGDPVPLGHWRPDLPAGLAQLVAVMLRRDPRLRPQDLHRLAADLLQWADELPRPAPP